MKHLGKVAERKKTTPKVPFKLVLVEWIDASRLSDSWMDLSAIPDAYLHKCVSVGFVVSENEDSKIIVPTIGDVDHPANSHTYGGMLIPRRAIISETILS